MALAPRDVPVTREQVDQWLKDWPATKQIDPEMTLEEYIHAQVAMLHLPDPSVDTSAQDDWDDETHLADMILADLPSYGYSYQ